MFIRILAAIGLSVSLASVSLLGFGGCPIGGGGGEGTFQSGDCSGGFCGSSQIDVAVDVSDAQALFTVQSDATSSSLSLDSEAQALTYGSESPLYAVTSTGVKGILTALDPNNTSSNASLPRVSLAAVNSQGKVFLTFEHPWTYCNTSADGTTISEYSDPWSPSSPFTCQIFVVSEAIGTDVTESDLICLDNSVEINTWDERTKGVQFDSTGNVYYAGHIFGNWKDLVYKYTPALDTTAAAVSASNSLALELKNAEGDENAEGGSFENFEFTEKLCADYTADSAARTELINANICFERFLVTQAGGVLYTGVTSGGGDCRGEPRFRYITPESELQQITSGWWDYTFAPIEEELENGTTDASFIGDILFYGPDPSLATSAGWNDSCLFRYDPDTAGSAASTKIADCNIDIWQYINKDADGNANTDATRKTNCEKKKTIMGGQNQPDKILMADNLEWRSTGGVQADKDDKNEIYIVGDIFEKEANEWKCDVCANNNAGGAGGRGSCVLATGALDLSVANDTEAECDASGGTWTNPTPTQWQCWNNQTAAAATGNVCTAANMPTDWTVTGSWCEFDGNSGRNTRSAISRVDEDPAGIAHTMTRLSADDEVVENGWVINDRIAYLAYNTTEGTYELNEITDQSVVDATTSATTQTLLSGIEVYELLEDPRAAANLEASCPEALASATTRWFFNGLRFEDNQYITGAFDPDATTPEDTLCTVEGITGQIETLVVVP